MFKVYINSSLANVKVTLTTVATYLASFDGFKASFKAINDAKRRFQPHCSEGKRFCYFRGVT